MRLSFSTNAFTGFSAYEAVDRIASIGYEGVEVLADRPHLWAFGADEAEIEKIRSLGKRRRIKVSNINANTASGYEGERMAFSPFEPSLSSPDEKGRAWRVEYTKRCVDIAVRLGSENVSVTSGVLTDRLGIAEAREIFKGSLFEVLEYASSKGVRIGIEYEPGLLIGCARDLHSILEEVGSPWLGANLDLGHSHVLGEAPEEVLRLLADRIFHIHLEDIKGRIHFHLIPGIGDMDFQRIFDELENICYAGYLTVELYTYAHMPEEAARRALKFLNGMDSRSVPSASEG